MLAQSGFYLIAKVPINFPLNFVVAACIYHHPNARLRVYMVATIRPKERQEMLYCISLTNVWRLQRLMWIR